MEARYHMEMFEEKGRKIRKCFSKVMLKCEPLFTKMSPRSDEESQEQTESKLESVRSVFTLQGLFVFPSFQLPMIF